jgi:CRISPR-associated protein Cmr3
MASDDTRMVAVSKELQVTISPHDPVVLRDGRPFSSGGEGANHARSLDWPYPSTTTGAVRTLVGNMASGQVEATYYGQSLFHDTGFLTRLKGVNVWGPLPLSDGNLHLPGPLDFLVTESGKRYALRPSPLGRGEGCDLPEGIWPVLVPSAEKPARTPAFWPMEAASRWLAEDVHEGFDPGDGLAPFPKDERVHVRVNPATGAADGSQLFSTQGLVIPDIDGHWTGTKDGTRPLARACRLALLVQTQDPDLGRLLARIDTLYSFGGERRAAVFRAESLSSLWKCPESVNQSLNRCSSARMLLATPAVFRHGWLPGWLDSETLEGAPPGAANLKLRLRGACVGRWRPISGWSLERGRFGPKPVRRLAPAGSVYFFEVLEGTVGNLAEQWLHPVSDDAQDRKDGFGLAAWGVWHRESVGGGTEK